MWHGVDGSALARTVQRVYSAAAGSRRESSSVISDHLTDRHGLVIVARAMDRCLPVALARLRGAAARPVPGRERSGRPVRRATLEFLSAAV